MASVRGKEWRIKLPVTCSPDESTETEIRENLRALDKKGDEDKLDTDSVSSEESVDSFSQSQVNFPAKLKRENARHFGHVPADEADCIECNPSSKQVSEWSVTQVKEWAFKTFGNENIADNFEKEEIDGKILLSTAVQSIQAMEQLGLTTIGKKGKFLETLKELTANKRASVDVSTSSVGKKGKLTLPDIKCLDPASKSIYLTVRSRIRRATENEFPGNSIPTFRSNPEAKKRLDVLVKQLAKSCSIQELNFGEEGIRSHIISVLNERRRMVALGHNYEDKRKSSDSDSEESPSCSQLKRQKNEKSDSLKDSKDSRTSSGDSNSDDGPETNVNESFDKLSVKSAEVITMAVFKETKMRDVKLHKQILPACRYLKVAGVRGKSKPSVTKLLAQAFIDKEYVVINDKENCNLANLTFSDITLSSDKDIESEVKEWQRADF